MIDPAKLFALAEDPAARTAFSDGIKEVTQLVADFEALVARVKALFA